MDAASVREVDNGPAIASEGRKGVNSIRATLTRARNTPHPRGNRWLPGPSRSGLLPRATMDAESRGVMLEHRPCRGAAAPGPRKRANISPRSVARRRDTESCRVSHGMRQPERGSGRNRRSSIRRDPGSGLVSGAALGGLIFARFRPPTSVLAGRGARPAPGPRPAEPELAPLGPERQDTRSAMGRVSDARRGARAAPAD
jgi:hypothetical protein